MEAMAMNIDAALELEETLMTPEEREDFLHDPSKDTMDEIPRWFLHKTIRSPTPDESGRVMFEKRKPAFGLTLSQIGQLEQHAQHPGMTEGGKRRFFRILRETMCRNLISPSDCSTTLELCNILRAEVESGVPAPVPEWYVFSEVRYGPRRMGYRKCDNRGCFKTETLLVESIFPQCSRCKKATYCSRDCQAADWKNRHKILCKQAKAEMHHMQLASAVLEGYARQYD